MPGLVAEPAGELKPATQRTYGRDWQAFMAFANVHQAALRDEVGLAVRVSQVLSIEVMPLITWDDSIKVGLWTIDTQHERWVGFINDLHEAMLAGKGKDVLGQTLAAMIDYTRTHFADEEELMSMHRYPGCAKHKALHDAYVARVLDLERRAQAGEIGMSREVLNSLKDWLVNHIQVADRDFVPLLKSKGVV